MIGPWVFLLLTAILVLEMFGFLVAGVKLWANRSHRGMWMLALFCFGQFARTLCRYGAEAHVITKPVRTEVGTSLHIAAMAISAVTLWVFVAYLYGHWEKRDHAS